jgi:hypothetical protein
MPDLPTASQFIAATARVLDRRRFERHFEDGEPGPVRDAVAAYRNADGGFGQALEPDGRTPHSQPAAVELALRTLHEADAWDEALAEGACDWLERAAPAEGGAVFVAPSVDGWPHAPWWRPEEGLPASLVSTGQIAGTLLARGTEHPWLDRATELLWERIETLGGGHAYELYGVVRFLDHVGDRDRARDALERRVAGALRAVVNTDPAAGETHGPLGFAPHQDSIARALFGDAEIDADLDRLAAGQREDGGWDFDFPAWSPAAQADWRGSITVDALLTLREHGRL